MKNNFLLFSCLLLTLSLTAQNTSNWFPPGAKWQYEYLGLAGPGLEILELVGTEVIGGQSCAKLHHYGYHQGFNPGPVDYGFEYFYAQNDSVFRWTDSAFKLWHDFTRQVGDTIASPSNAYQFGIVDSTGITTVFNNPVRFQDITLYNDAYPAPYDQHTTRVYERIGGLHLLYWDQETPLSEIQYGLTCYFNDQYPAACNISYSADYHPFPSGTATWSEEDGSFCGFRGYQYKLEGDTVIPGLGSGKKLYARNTYLGNIGCGVPPNENLHEPFQLQGLLSQNILAKKVFFTRLAADPILPLCVNASGGDFFPLHQSVLLYDFNFDALMIGDTIPWANSYKVLMGIDSVQLKNGSWRRTFLFDQQGYDFWIEGIGSSRGLFNSYANLQLTDIGCSLNCFRENNQLQYPKTANNAAFCDSLVVGTTNPGDLNASLRLYPNPATDAVTLELPADAVPALARLMDVQGREVGRRQVTEAVTQWSLPALGASRVLLLYLQTPDGRTGGRVLRIE